MLNSIWDGRPFGLNRHEPKSRGVLYPFWGIGEGQKPGNCSAQALRWNGRHSLTNNYFRGYEMSIVVRNRGSKTSDVHWLTETLIGSSKVALYAKWCRAWLPWRTITTWKSGDESNAEWRLQDKVWKVGNMAMKIMGLVVYNVAWAEATSVPRDISIHPAVWPQ